MLKHIEKLQTAVSTKIIIGAISLFAPGILIVFYFDRELFITLSFIKMLSLSVALISPFIIVNFAIFLSIFGGKSDGELKEEKATGILYLGCLTMGSIITNLILTTTLLLSIIFSLSFTIFMYTAIIIQFLFIVIVVWQSAKNMSQEPSNSPK